MTPAWALHRAAGSAGAACVRCSSHITKQTTRDDRHHALVRFSYRAPLVGRRTPKCRLPLNIEPLHGRTIRTVFLALVSTTGVSRQPAAGTTSSLYARRVAAAGSRRAQRRDSPRRARPISRTPPEQALPTRRGQERREKVMTFFLTELMAQAWLDAEPGASQPGRSHEPHWFSYPCYSEILTAKRTTTIKSTDACRTRSPCSRS